jgi:hypothetical protein
MPAKWDRCVSKVKKSGGAVNPYAVCTAQLECRANHALPFVDVYTKRKPKEALGISGAGKPLARAGVKK